jgi:hypothetical protein
MDSPTTKHHDFNIKKTLLEVHVTGKSVMFANNYRTKIPAKQKPGGPGLFTAVPFLTFMPAVMKGMKKYQQPIANSHPNIHARLRSGANRNTNLPQRLSVRPIANRQQPIAR